MTLSQDILAELAEIAPDSALAAARAVREEAMKHCLVSRITTFRSMSVLPLPPGSLSCMRAMRWRPTMPVLVSPTPHPRGWSRRWPLPDC